MTRSGTAWLAFWGAFIAGGFNVFALKRWVDGDYAIAIIDLIFCILFSVCAQFVGRMVKSNGLVDE